MGKLVEVVGEVNAGDEVVISPSSDLAATRIKTHRLSQKELETLLNESSKED
jgi:hypothetical protein